MIGIVPSNTGELGAADTAARLFIFNEIEPLQRRFAQLNERLRSDVVRFKTYEMAACEVKVMR